MILKTTTSFISVKAKCIAKNKSTSGILVLLLFMASTQSSSQEILLDLEGGLKLGAVSAEDPAPGTIRYQENSFEGWNGFTWVRLGGFTIFGEVVDIDGNRYPTVKIANKEWMAENLRVMHYNDGTDMQIRSGGYIINFGATGTIHYPNDNSNAVPEYGCLYDFYCIESDKLCPVGWHVPSIYEWQDMIDFLGGDEIAGIAIKESGNTHWTSQNSGSNESGFTARGAGRWHETPQGPTGFLYDAFLWTRTSVNFPYFRHMTSPGTDIAQAQATSKLRGCSVRCMSNN
jgi:uncharacterized protein (TIGR02145 family)